MDKATEIKTNDLVIPIVVLILTLTLFFFMGFVAGRHEYASDRCEQLCGGRAEAIGSTCLCVRYVHPDVDAGIQH